MDETSPIIDGHDVKEGDIIFLKIDYLPHFFNNVHPRISHPYILITHNGDYPAPQSFGHYLDSPKIIAWFAQNIENFSHPKLHPIPIGIANPCYGHGNIELVKKAQEEAKTTPKTRLLYMNFSRWTHEAEREPLYQEFKDALFCTYSPLVDFTKYLPALAESKFTLSPRGNGLDTHRTWEALLMGTIPIVRTSLLDPLFEDLPVIIVKNWTEVTEQFLNEKWEEMRKRNYKLEKIYARYWLNLIDSYKTKSKSYTVEKSLKDGYSIVFIHIGSELPLYLNDSIRNARLFNPDCPIYLIANGSALENLSAPLKEQNLHLISCESLEKTAEHLQYKDNIPGGPNADGFWVWTSERFLYLDDFIRQYELSHVFHLENDVMLYADLQELFPTFQKYYRGIGATFDHDSRCIPGFFYYDNPQVSHALATCFASEAHHGHNDMGMIPICRKKACPSDIQFLPIIPDTYATHYPLVARFGYRSQNPGLYWNHFEDFQSIFDAATIGQYLCSDPENRFVNESCLFDPSLFGYEWILDDKGRKVPFMLFQGEKYRINNLHIHCKQLHRFAS